MKKENKVWKFIKFNPQFGWKKWVLFILTIAYGWYVGRNEFDNTYIGAGIGSGIAVLILFLYWYFIDKKIKSTPFGLKLLIGLGLLSILTWSVFLLSLVFNIALGTIDIRNLIPSFLYVLQIIIYSLIIKGIINRKKYAYYILTFLIIYGFFGVIYNLIVNWAFITGNIEYIVIFIFSIVFYIVLARYIYAKRAYFKIKNILK